MSLARYSPQVSWASIRVHHDAERSTEDRQHERVCRKSTGGDGQPFAREAVAPHEFKQSRCSGACDGTGTAWLRDHRLQRDERLGPGRYVLRSEVGAERTPRRGTNRVQAHRAPIGGREAVQHGTFPPNQLFLAHETPIADAFALVPIGDPVAARGVPGEYRARIILSLLTLAVVPRSHRPPTRSCHADRKRKNDPGTVLRYFGTWSASLNVSLARRGGNGRMDLIIDSSGLAVVGEGEWAAAKHVSRGRRGC